MALSLGKKISKTDWLDIGDGQQLKIDYPTLEQAQKLDEIIFNVAEAEDETAKRIPMLEYQRLFIKFTIKDWKGFSEPCKLVDNELDNDLWSRLVRSFHQTSVTYDLINNELEWTEVDKKK